MKHHTLPLALALSLPLLSPAAPPAPGPQAAKMLQALEPWLNPDNAPAQGTGGNVGDLAGQVTPEIKAAVPENLSVPTPTKRRVLVLTAGTLGPLHAPGAAGFLLLLREASAKFPSAFEFVERFDDSGLDAKSLDGFDAVILNNIGQVAPANAGFYNETLPAYVQGGGGLLAIHGTALLFRQQPEAAFNKLLGGFTTENPVHPKRHGRPFPVRVPDPANPLAAAFAQPPQKVSTTAQWLAGKEFKFYKLEFDSPAQLADELYTFNPLSNADGSAKIIAAIDKEKLAGNNDAPGYDPATPDFGYALCWHRPHGKGRVYYTQFGHNFAIFSVRAVAASILDGLQHACGDLSPNGTPRP